LRKEDERVKNSRFSEEQIIGILKQSEAGAKTSELCRQHGISAATFYGWRSKYGGLEVSEAKRLKQLEEENAKLKRIVADQALDITMLKDLVGKKCMVRLFQSREKFMRIVRVNVSGLWVEQAPGHNERFARARP
jgi:putative transposase